MDKITALILKWHDTKDISLASDICEMLYKNIAEGERGEDGQD